MNNNLLPNNSLKNEIKEHRKKLESKLKKTDKKTKIVKTIIHGVLSPIHYGLFCTLMNGTMHNVGKTISQEQAEKIIRVESQKKYLQNKNLKLVYFEEKFLEQKKIGGINYSVNDSSYIGFDKNNITDSKLYHEIGHAIWNKTNSQTYSLDEVIISINEAYDSNGTKRNVKETIKYIFSPEELFCNIYSIYSVLKKKK